MRELPLVIGATFLGGCGLLFPPQEEPSAPISSSSAATSPSSALQDAGVIDPETAILTRGTRHDANEPEIIEITVDPSNRDEMGRLIPYLTGTEEWMILGVQMLADDRRAWRFMRLGPPGTALPNPLQPPTAVRRLQLRDLSVLPTDGSSRSVLINPLAPE